MKKLGLVLLGLVLLISITSCSNEKYDVSVVDEIILEKEIEKYNRKDIDKILNTISDSEFKVYCSMKVNNIYKLQSTQAELVLENTKKGRYTKDFPKQETIKDFFLESKHEFYTVRRKSDSN